MRAIGKHYQKQFLILWIVVLGVFIIGSTFAFWTQELWVENEYQLGTYSTKIEEEFEAPSNWLPGEKVNKDVRVANEGTSPVLVKMYIHLKWLGKGETADKAHELTFVSEQTKVEEYAALISWGEDVVLLAGGRATAESLQLDIPIVHSMEEAAGKWLLLNERPDEEGNLIFYYMDILQPNKTTPLLVDYVRMNPKIEAEILETYTVYEKENEKWVTQYKENPSASYENARFLLTVKAQTVQATKGAVKEIFTGDTLTEQLVVGYLMQTTQGKGRNARESKETKELYIEELAGEIRFTPVNNNGDAWFMSFWNMLPGETYIDTLSIKNDSKKDYDIYVQVIPREKQTAQLEKLLEHIYMKVYMEETMIYNGTAIGKEYANSINDLQKAVFLGKYKAGMGNQIRVELQLKEDTEMKYQDLLTKIDWKFAAVERENPNQTNTPNRPKTGDGTKAVIYSILMLASVFGILIGMKCLKKGRNEKRGNIK